MDLSVLLRSARSGDHQLTFQAAVLAAATTRHPGSTRWTELTVYRQPKAREEPPRGGYIVSKVGRSLVAHAPGCRLARPSRMDHWSDVDADQWRVACLESNCNPSLSRLDPTTLLERDRHTVLQARNADDLAKVLMTQGMVASAVRGMTAEIVHQLRLADGDFDRWWVEEIAPNLMEDD